MQISCIEKHLRASLGSFSSLRFSPFSSLLFYHIQSLGIWSCPLFAPSLFGGGFLLALFLPFPHRLLEDLFLVLLLPLPLCLSVRAAISFRVALQSGGGFDWRLYVQSGVNTFSVDATAHKDG